MYCTAYERLAATHFAKQIVNPIDTLARQCLWLLLGMGFAATQSRHFFAFFLSPPSLQQEMCDAGDAWDVIGRAPAALTFSALTSAFLAPDAMPGGGVAFFIGLVTAAVVARVLKLATMTLSGHAAWAMRPVVAGYCASPGFPSSHCMVMGFAVGAFASETYRNARRRRDPRRVAFLALLGVLTVLVAISRGVQRCHTALQCAVGIALGLTLGAGYGALFVGDVKNH